MAAVLACGPGTVLSHRSAASLHGIRPTAIGYVDVAVARHSRPSHAGIRAHRLLSLSDDDLTRIDGIPCTTVARTLVDLAGVVDRRALERACEQAEVLRLDVSALPRLVQRSRGARGIRALRAILASRRLGQSITRSELEERFLALCLRAGVPMPSVNAWIVLEGRSVEVDFLWRDERVVVETDGYRFHSSRRAFTRDRQRDRALDRAGFRHARFTWDEVVSGDARVDAEVRALLSRRE